jgi:hypothetical protein
VGNSEGAGTGTSNGDLNWITNLLASIAADALRDLDRRSPP